VTRRTVVIPAGVMVTELEFAIAYLAAANRDRDLLGEDRRAFAEAIAAMLAERAGRGISGMQVTRSEHQGEQP
jgi:hypothetical protein